MNITSNQQKIALVDRLLEQKVITFKEAIILLETEVHIEYVSYPWQYPITYRPTYVDTPMTYTLDTCLQ